MEPAAKHAGLGHHHEPRSAVTVSNVVDLPALSWRRHRAYQVATAVVDVMRVSIVGLGAVAVCWGIWAAIRLHNAFNRIGQQYDQINAQWDRLAEAMRNNTPLPAPLDHHPLPPVDLLPFGLTFPQLLLGIGIHAAIFTAALLALALLEPHDAPSTTPVSEGRHR